MKVGFIGTGNMGGALAKAAAKKVPGAELFLADRDGAKAAALAKELGAQAVDTLTLVRTCDMIFLGVKPQVMGEMLSQIAPALEGRADVILVSMAAGVEMASIRAEVGKAGHIIRIMPNMPAAVGEGMILYAAEDDVPRQAVDAFLQVLGAAGKLDALPEKLIDAGTSVSGCGPAYAYLFMEALADGGVMCGLPRDKAMLYAAQMLKGAAETVLATGEHPGKLKDGVCSPGGSTIAGVRALEKGSFRSDAMEAVCAAYARNRELGK